MWLISHRITPNRMIHDTVWYRSSRKSHRYWYRYVPQISHDISKILHTMSNTSLLSPTTRSEASRTVWCIVYTTHQGTMIKSNSSLAYTYVLLYELCCSNPQPFGTSIDVRWTAQPSHTALVHTATPRCPRGCSKQNTVIMREMAPIGEMVPIQEMAPGWGKRSKKGIFNCIFAPPSERRHRVRSQRCKSKSRCYAPGPRGDIRAPLVSRTIATGPFVVSTLFTRGNESSCFLLIGIKIVRSQPSSQHTYGTCRLQPPRSQKELVWYYGIWCRWGRTRTTVGS